MSRRFVVPKIDSSEITPESVYLNRRELMRAAGLGLSTMALAAAPLTAASTGSAPRPLDFTSPEGEQFSSSEQKTPYADITAYNNFYEFGTDKDDPARYAKEMTIDPWAVEVSGLVLKPGKLNLEDLLSGFDLEERIYRLRCVEAWSMVVPWIGFPLADLLQRFQPLSTAKYVEFRTLYRRSEMRGTRSFGSIIDWPYREGLRLDEAMHPLTLIAVGLYGKTLPHQNGAPLRLVVPWKYGFKSIKSIVSIKLVDRQPATSWQSLAPREYGFYSNVNPAVDHPRWSQKFERRLPSSLFRPNRIPTRMFNGYEEQVAELYRGMDLSKYY
ncbi:protein-methionine-sulfoxide reductase catalytic subunit MsrP [Parahaliea sp. F7430]|uniref:Protein-methionine-sulfoxide reductase catalytic subunit MsrP n=1 Tax=Sediminihaliea albiluteola TaxID=2758564 RepID=A0A7W2YK92_9GAMM|nr:protein-methionine-sulfoxide reductase catalytic subunit MsrP [Sediminihaliea albiluteola]MBA6414381.1 protein-methionine-sulfoxide reductase catalytic subunit MsrP [Sediminihaliea albiluteola]